MTDLPAVIEALSKLAWPLLAVVVLLLLYRPLRRMITSRSFSIKVGDLQISVQEASEQLRQQIEDLQRQVAELLRGQASTSPTDITGEIPAAGPRTAPSRHQPPTILWVDDQPRNNALLVASLRDQGLSVDLARSTDEALSRLTSSDYAVVISDMGRKEDRTYISDAGMQLLRGMRQRHFPTPIVFYTSRRGEEHWRTRAMAEGAAITSSPVELLARLAALGIPAA